VTITMDVACGLSKEHDLRCQGERVTIRVFYLASGDDVTTYYRPSKFRGSLRKSSFPSQWQSPSDIKVKGQKGLFCNSAMRSGGGNCVYLRFNRTTGSIVYLYGIALESYQRKLENPVQEDLQPGSILVPRPKFFLGHMPGSSICTTAICIYFNRGVDPHKRDVVRRH
jgi:hypothetical protein